MISICIHTPIDFAIHFPVFEHLGCFDIFQISSLCSFFFKLVLGEVHIFDEIVSSVISNVKKGLMNLSLGFLFFEHGVATDASF